MTTSIEVWPQLGTTVTLESGYVITAAGAVAVLTSEIRTLLYVTCRLLDRDPTQENPNPSPIPPSGGGSGGLSASTVAQLGLTSADSDGVLCNMLGYTSTNDGGQGVFVWAAGSSTPVVPGVVVAASGGRWKRLYSGSINPRWLGAVGDGVADDTSAISSALSLGKDVCLSQGTYKITGVLDLGDNQTLYGDSPSAVLKVAYAGFGVRIRNTRNSTVRDLKIDCTGTVGASGVRIEASGGPVFFPSVSRCVIELATTGASYGIDCYCSELISGNVIYNPQILEPDIHGPNSNTLAAGATGIRMRGVSGSFSRCTGARVTNGRISFVNRGVDLDNCDTWTIIGTCFDSCLQSSSIVSTSNNGKAILFGPCAQVCSAVDVRVEDCDTAYETSYDAGLGFASQECRFHCLQGFLPDVIKDTAGSDILTADEHSRRQAAYYSARRASFGTSLELGHFGDTVLSNGANQNVAGNSGTVTPTIRITGPSGAFSIGSFNLPAAPVSDATQISGTILHVYNTTAQVCTVKHQDATATASKRIVTLTGADVAVPGPSVMRFIYDDTLNGSGAKRWVFMGAG